MPGLITSILFQPIETSINVPIGTCAVIVTVILIGLDFDFTSVAPHFLTTVLHFCFAI